MNGSIAQQKVYAGYGKAAGFVGQPYALKRATSATSSTETLVATIPAAFNQEATFSRPNKYGNALWIALFDGTLADVGDYLIGPKTYFIAAMQHLLPILCVECNGTVSVLRPTQPTGNGAVGYGGDISSSETVLMQGWPASILQGTKGEKNPANLPGDERLPWWQILIPYYAGVIINTSDVVSDDLGRRYVVSSSELTAFGWRLSAGMVGA